MVPGGDQFLHNAATIELGVLHFLTWNTHSLLWPHYPPWRCQGKSSCEMVYLIQRGLGADGLQIMSNNSFYLGLQYSIKSTSEVMNRAPVTNAIITGGYEI